MRRGVLLGLFIMLWATAAAAQLPAGTMTVVQPTGSNLHVACDSGCSGGGGGTVTQGPGGVSAWLVNFGGTQQPVYFSTPQHVIVDSFGSSLAVTGTFWQSTQPVSIASMPSTPVTGTFWQTTQPVSATSLPLPTLAATSTKQSDGTQKTQLVDGSGNVIGATSNALDINIKSGNPTTITATQGTGANLHVAVDSAPTTAVTCANCSGTVTVSGSVTTTPPADATTNITKFGGTSVTIGQQAAAASIPVILPAATVTTLTPPAAITGFALETGGNIAMLVTNTTSIATAARQDTGNTSLGTIATNTTGVALDASVTADRAALGTTTAPTKLAVVGGKTSDPIPQYQPIPLTSNGVAVPVVVNNQPAIQRVIAVNNALTPAAVRVTNFPTTLDQLAASSRVVDVVGPVSTLANINDVAVVSAEGHSTFGVAVQAGSFVGAIAPECSMDGGVSWYATFFDLSDTSKVAVMNLNAPTATSQATLVPVGGCGLYRVRVTAVAVGNVQAQLRATMASDMNALFNAPNGSTNVPPSVAVIGGVDQAGTVRTMSMTATGLPQVVTFPGRGLPLPLCNPVVRYNCQAKGF